MEPRHPTTFSGRLRKKILSHLRHKLGAGLLLVIPLGITLFFLRFLFNLADGVLAPYIRRIGTFFFGEGIYIPGLGMIAGLIVLYLTGLLATNVLGKRIVNYWDGLLTRIPLVKTIYLSAKQFMHVISNRGRSSFRRAVFVDFPRDGTLTIAFTTNETVSESDKKYFTCFVPTSPNPTSGYVLILHESRVYPAPYTVEEAMRIIMSGGMVTPEPVASRQPREEAP